jgi:SAM-dependent MidA family methyltransferase
MGVQWITSLPDALKQTGGKALIFSNELVDAFPCRLFEKNPDGWNELGVTLSVEGSLSECIIAKIPIDPWLEQFSSYPTGQRVERHDSYRVWIRNWSSHWKEGSLLTIDYGDTADSLYHRRPKGSLRAYLNHERITGPSLYARFGRQDITADVNFTDLVSWGKDLGWTSHHLMSQLEFLNEWMSKGSQEISPRASQAGEANRFFKVLEQNPAS